MTGTRTLRVVPGLPTAVRSALDEVLRGRGAPFLPMPPDEASARRVRAAARPDEPLERDDCAVVLATSGSSGAPKAVVLSRPALVASADAAHERLGGPGQWVLALPAYLVGGLQVLTRGLVAGIEPVVAHGNFSAAAAELTHPRRYTALVPTQLARLLATEPDALRRFDAVLVGAAATPPELLARAQHAGVRVVTAYGMTETAGGCVYDGTPLAGVQIDIEPVGVPVPPGDPGTGGTDHAGRIVIGGPAVFSGYRLRPDLTAGALVDGRFRTSDRGRLVAGELQVLGRLDDVVVSGGVNVALPAVRERIRRHPRVDEVEVVGVPDSEWGSRVVAFVVGTAARDELRDFVSAELPRTWAPREVVYLGALPMLASGKVDRARLLELAG